MLALTSVNVKHYVEQMIHQGHGDDFVVCVLITSNLGQSPKNLLYSSLPSAVHTSVDSVPLFELAGAPYVSWEHKEHLILLMAPLHFSRFL